MKVTVQDVHKAIAERAAEREMRRRRLVLIVGLALGLAALSLAPVLLPGCYDQHDPRIPEPDYPYAEKLDADGCERFCGALERLRCPEARPKSATCQAICERSSSIRAWPLDCVEMAQTQIEVRACQGIRCR